MIAPLGKRAKPICALSIFALILTASLGGPASAQEAPPAATPSAVRVAPVRELPDAMPADVLDEMISTRNLVGMPTLVWNRKVLTVAFDGGSDVLYELIEQTASEWTSHGGELRFSFRTQDGKFRHWSAQDIAPAAAIRVSFRTDPGHNGYWSAVGRLAENLAANRPTLNLDGFPQKAAAYVSGHNASGWAVSYEHSVVLHEFGHTLGLAHEHFHPECQADLKLEMAIASLKKPPNQWPNEVARFNMDAVYYFSVTSADAGANGAKPVFSAHIDQASVMLYGFSDDFYKSGAASPCKPTDSRGFATTLSASDIQFYLDKYTHVVTPY
jgi:hypothetical protein